MTLRDYQERTVIHTLAALRRGATPVVVAPTGSGKTVIAVEIAHRFRAYGMGERIVFVSNRYEHLEQAERAGLVGETRTVFKRSRLDACDLLIIDEAQHSPSRSYEKLHAAHVVGLTATPFRLDGRPLTRFGEIIVAARPRELVQQGYLIEPRVYAYNPPSMKGVHSRAGDYVTAESYSVMAGIAGDVVAEWLRIVGSDLLARRRTLVFAVNNVHAFDLAARFLAVGVRAVAVTADTPRAERAQAFTDLQAGRLDVVANCMIATEGLDIPALDVVSIARPTKSLSLHLQMIGRAMRTHPGKTAAIVLDHAGNHARLGDALQHIDYSLDGVVSSQPAKWHGLWRCPKCFTLNKPAAKACVCGAEKPAPKLPKEQAAATLTEGFKHVGMACDERTYRSLLLLARRKGYKDGWAAYVYKKRNGVMPDWNMTRRVQSSLTSQAAPMS